MARKTCPNCGKALTRSEECGHSCQLPASPQPPSERAAERAAERIKSDYSVAEAAGIIREEYAALVAAIREALALLDKGHAGFPMQDASCEVCDAKALLRAALKAEGGSK